MSLATRNLYAFINAKRRTIAYAGVCFFPTRDDALADESNISSYNNDGFEKGVDVAIVPDPPMDFDFDTKRDFKSS